MVENSLSVSEITRQLKELVESNFYQVSVMGEISNCTKAGSGHIYLTLKDDSSQLRGVMWRSKAERLKFDVHDGLEVIATGPIEVYAARGSYQMIIERLQPQGIGPLELAFQQMREKLAAEGLFDVERKRALPHFPRKIALVTSPTSAAVRDMLQVLTRRWNVNDIIVLPVRVQGAGAAEEIAAALNIVQTIPGVDLVITGRGGGSLEDLWAFNEEVVARAIANCPIPVISAVGHEIDITIADLVADRRALTPSEAAELAVPLQDDFQRALLQMQQRMTNALRDRSRWARTSLDAISSRRLFTHPLELVHDKMQYVDAIEDRLQRAIKTKTTSSQQQIDQLALSLDALSPLAVLQRGYSITTHAKTGKSIRSPKDVKPGDKLCTRLSDGEITSRVE
ncbi:Exodeoxyribonuclease VII large subunit [hydrothermal vent metagenome]|uniref:Exodeoxyribonuclease VII large subunit n=1 Tax=hydrothermal vent metagenome TaxID=652676 RepID=A0A3B1DXM6_9ZZZZ